MNCPSCLSASVGFLSAYWLTLAVSLCIAGAAVLTFVWAWKTGQFKDVEAAKHEMLRRVNAGRGPYGI